MFIFISLIGLPTAFAEKSRQGSATESAQSVDKIPSISADPKPNDIVYDVTIHCAMATNFQKMELEPAETLCIYRDVARDQALKIFYVEGVLQAEVHIDGELSFEQYQKFATGPTVKSYRKHIESALSNSVRKCLSKLPDEYVQRLLKRTLSCGTGYVHDM